VFVGAIMNKEKNIINILKTSIVAFSVLSIFNFIGIANSSYGLYNKTADSKNFFILKTTTKKYCKSKSCDFDYTGDEQMFVAPKTGTYKLETWGAQGGGSSYGGYGSYSIGTLKLISDVTLSIYIGEHPTKCDSISTSDPCIESGGYNGGGKSSGDGRGGGGATHIATKSGLLSTLENSKDSIMIVSGGGGGGNRWTPNRHEDGGSGMYAGQTPGGNAGGYIGNRGTYSGSTTGWAYGGTQTSGGNIACPSCRYVGSKGAFGSGGSAAAGSGYIGNTSLTDKHMACYNCETSNEESTKTISVTCASETPTTDCAKIGNGYARITYLGN